MCRINKSEGLSNIHLFDKTIKNVLLESTWKSLKFLKEVKSSVIRMASSHITGAKVSAIDAFNLGVTLDQ